MRPSIKGAVRIAEIAAGDVPVYGINTGFGKLACIRIDAADVATLQRNLILSHCCGVGTPLDEDVVRLIMTLKLISLGRGASGVRLEIVRLIERMLERGVVPIIPGKGSVGASGDLAPLAHMSAVMMGQGEAMVDGERMDGGAAMGKAGLKPIAFAAKEGLALINGTQVVDGAGARGSVSGSSGDAGGAHYGGAFDGRRDGFTRSLSRGNPLAARSPGPDRYGGDFASTAGRLTHPGKPPRRGRARAGPRTASVASRRWTARASTSCARWQNRWKSKPTR